MKKSRLIEILRTCSKKELRELKKWVQSPAHNQREDVILLYNYLIEDEYLWKDEFIAKSVAFRSVYPKSDFDDAKMRQSIFFFMKTLEDFLIYKEVQRDVVQSKMFLSRFFRRKRIDRSFRKNIRSIGDLQQNTSIQNHDFYKNGYLLQRELYNFTVSGQRTIGMNLQEVSNALDISYLADKLRHSCHMLAHQSVYKTGYEFNLIEGILDYVKSSPDILSIPAISIYYYGYKTNTEQHNESHFYALKKQLFKHGSLFPHDELMAIYLMALNYCIRRINAGFIKFRKESFDLYKEGIETEILIKQGNITRFTFSNIVTSGTYLKEFEWVENFIHKYKSYLDEKSRNDVVLFNMAKLHYEKRDFDAALQICSQADYDDILMNLYSRAMVIKIYYQLGEYDVLDSYLESFRNYVVRKRDIGYHKSNYKNIIRLTKKLLKVNPYSKKDKEKLKKEIEEANPLTERSWLLEQLEKSV